MTRAVSDLDVNLLSSDVRRPTRPPRPSGRVVRHRGVIQAGVLTLERGAWVRAIDAQGDQISDLYDPRFLCRLELGDGAVCCTPGGAFDVARVLRVHDGWEPRFDVACSLLGRVQVMPATGLRR